MNERSCLRRILNVLGISFLYATFCLSASVPAAQKEEVTAKPDKNTLPANDSTQKGSLSSQEKEDSKKEKA